MDESFPPPSTEDSGHSTESSNIKSRRSPILAIVIVFLVLVLGMTLVAFAGYRYVRTNLGTWLGARRDVSRQNVPSARSDLYGTLAGLKIVGPDSPASRAGLKYGDVLIAYNKHPITNQEEIDAVMTFFEGQRGGKSSTAELSLYRDGDMTVKTIRVQVGRLGIYTREWTFAGAFVEDAIIDRDD